MPDVTIYTLAKELNMTPSMVSRAFNPKARISESKRKIILKTAEKYHFRPDGFASRLSKKPIRIGVLIRSKFQINADKIIEGIHLAHEQIKSYKIKYDVSIFDFAVSDDEILKKLEQYKDYDGIILSGMSHSRYTATINEVYHKNKNIVQVQSVNTEALSLFISKHDETVSSGLAVDFLHQCLKNSKRKNLLLFTGELSNPLHSNAATNFEAYCKAKGMSLLEVLDMKDNEEYFESILPVIFSKYANKIDGIYITSGCSHPLCSYMEVNGIDLPLVTFDTHSGIKHYMDKGIISASISQNVTHQMKIAFEALVLHIITNQECPSTLYTPINLMLKSNMHQFD